VVYIITREGCDPISIPDDDPHFKPGGCMNFARSNAKLDDSGKGQMFISGASSNEI